MVRWRTEMGRGGEGRAGVESTPLALRRPPLLGLRRAPCSCVHVRPAPRFAVATRLRPILMTAITSVIGMFPLALGGGAGSELYQGLGAILVGGLVVSNFFTLFLVPLLVSIGRDWRAAWSARKASARVQ